MNTLLSLLALITITILGMEYAFFGKTAIVQSAFNARMKFKITSRQGFILLLLGTGIVQAGEFSALLLLIWIVFLLYLLFKYDTSFATSRVVLFYGLYLIWLVISIIQTPETGYGFRVFAKYVFPFLVLLVVANTPITTAFFLKALHLSFWTMLAANALILLPSILPIGFITGPIFGPILWYGPAIIDATPFSIAAALLLYRITKKKMYLYAILVFIAVPLLASIRTGLIGIGVGLLAMSFFTYKIRALPFFIVFVGMFVAAVVYVPNVRDKMFSKSFATADEVINNAENISTDNIESNGRFAMWEWSLDNYYKGNEIMGSGLGQLQGVFYSGKHPFGGIKVIHNEYVQMLCDTGLVGLILYLLIIISFVTHCYQIYNNTQNNFAARSAAFIAGTSLCGIMACAYTDNVINYSLVTLSYPYAFFGLALAMNSKKNKIPT